MKRPLVLGTTLADSEMVDQFQLNGDHSVESSEVAVKVYSKSQMAEDKQVLQSLGVVDKPDDTGVRGESAAHLATLFEYLQMLQK
mmetsp:Transcript_6045/g.10741  ORF Transcript_6045/g.10741 Transcript_6045/m.10741 type:complete len:85 (-) Transcript_6045:27-281(-)